MNADQALSLLDGLPMSSRIANEVFRKAERRYERKANADRKRQKNRPERDELVPERDELVPERDELVPLPKRPLTEQEWLAVFAALAKTSWPRFRLGQKLPPLKLLRFDLLDDRTLIQERHGGEFKVDPRFKNEGRPSVIATLCRECFPTSQSVGTENDTREAARVWLAGTRRMLERWSESFAGVDRSQPRNDEVSLLAACRVNDDARSISDRLGLAVKRLSDLPSFSDVIQYLDDLGHAITTPLETSSGGTTDDSAYVAAKTLREQQRMTAADCNKFLKRHGTTSEQPVEGKIRYRKPNKKRLDIHAADWLKFGSDVDRRQSDALEDDAMQEFLANAEAEKAKVKAKRKLG